MLSPIVVEVTFACDHDLGHLILKMVTYGNIYMGYSSIIK
jgi:hypothetical protein